MSEVRSSVRAYACACACARGVDGGWQVKVPIETAVPEMSSNNESATKLFCEPAVKEMPADPSRVNEQL